ncbi:MAG: hypothetical protein KF886_16860 [Candidatus Hydrogenedentes bacterium]|nr:hypothetical protein [Candidatus Hydrogenedentota bacterium]
MLEKLTVQRVLCFGGMLVSILFVVAMYSRYTLDFPYADQWDFVPLLEKAFAGELSWRDFLAQHNEHRLVFPRLLMFVLALVSDWDVRWELAASFLFALFTWALLCVQASLSGKDIDAGSNEAVYLVFALLIFSMSQWGNWFLGWQVQEFMNVFATVLAVMGLTWRRAPGPGVYVAVASAVVATFSFANGLLLWPIGLLLLFLQRGQKGYRAKAFKRYLTVWCGVGGAVAIVYFAGYARPPHHAPLSSALAQPRAVFFYVLAYLGQPVGRLEDVAVILGEVIRGNPSRTPHLLSIMTGALGMLIWTVTSLQLRLFGARRHALLPWLGLALYAVGTALLTGLGRVDQGIEQALSSRYVTMANLLWFPIAAQMHWAGQTGVKSFIQYLLPVKTGLLCAALLGASLAGAYRWSERYHAYDALRGELVSGDDAEILRPLYPPDPQVILERRPVLEQHGLSVFLAIEPPAEPEGD